MKAAVPHEIGGIPRYFDVVKVPLSDIETAWQRTDLRGGRLVVVP
ncbi:hypothetical protein [Catellatospora chokoriensis]|uniref:Zinc-binding alcohol dehydrogenase family protein n=1 Tax=Catellatospora chokoriensis TaxID=310353 RepID=A0A8J3NPZ1_9ACTN|nr:hypothetical protein [Catellatospora chokoriensis]GIF87718.1 hypothetical protein Cch02nite_11620 [Catellatospora chokoriensis]